MESERDSAEAEVKRKDLRADIFEIKPEFPYSEKDLDGYNEASRTYKDLSSNSMGKREAFELCKFIGNKRLVRKSVKFKL